MDIDKLSNIYSILYTLEYLERGLISGNIKFEEYKIECNSILNLFKLFNTINLQQFIQDFKIDFQLAINRINIGLPNNTHQDLGIFDLSGNFITLIDALKLGITNTNQLYMLINEIIKSIELNDKCYNGEEFWEITNLKLLKFWQQLLENTQELTIKQLQELLQDIESNYFIYRQHLLLH
uniref:VPS28 protein, putative n=1 Tax=Theileria annulata TaxID=5874 RepID=A0A3B0MYB1_THEAN